MILNTKHLLAMLNITATTQAFFDACEDFEADVLMIYNSSMSDFGSTIEEFFETSLCNKEWLQRKNYDNFFELIQGQGKYKEYTPEQRLSSLLAGPIHETVISVTDIEVDTDLYNHGFEKELKKDYKKFTKLKKGIMNIICGEGIEPSSESHLGIIQASFDTILKK